MTKKTYIAKTPIKHDGEDIEVGDMLELDDKKQAPALLEVGAIELAEEKKPAAKK